MDVYEIYERESTASWEGKGKETVRKRKEKNGRGPETRPDLYKQISANIKLVSKQNICIKDFAFMIKLTY